LMQRAAAGRVSARLQHLRATDAARRQQQQTICSSQPAAGSTTSQPVGLLLPHRDRGCQCCCCARRCAGGVISPDLTPTKNDCGEGMTTIGRRSASKASCINLPGYAFVPDANGDPTAEPCPPDTWNSGMRRQRTCYPCPIGYTTNGEGGKNELSDCGELPDWTAAMRRTACLLLCAQRLLSCSCYILCMCAGASIGAPKQTMSWL
jgi:hypothetical protein